MPANNPAEFIRTKKVLLFDLFHTLTPPESLWSGLPFTSDRLGVSREAWNEQLLDKSTDRLKGFDKDPYSFVEKMAHAIDPAIPELLIEEAVEARIERFRSALVNIPHEVRETLRALKQSGKTIALISNADVSEAAGWNDSPIRDYFDATVFSCDVGMMKPDREIYLYTLDLLHTRAEDAVFIGDGGSDELRGAKDTGISAIMMAGVIREIWPEAIDARRKDADYVIERISELLT
ncbi:MAG: HAD family hydrolase [Brevinematales bacterium]|nr:HAD family hydrolase [Brevinematales bacterium]